MCRSSMIADRVRLPLVATLLAAVALLAPTPPSPEHVTPVDDVPLTMVPLSGAPLADAIERSGYQQCLPFLAAITSRPGWRLQIANHASSCTRTRLVGSFAVDHTGAVTWTVPDLPVRSLALTADELDQITKLDALDCVRITELHYGEVSYRVAVGTDVEAADGAYIPADSKLGHALDAILGAAIARYHARRLTELGWIDLQLRMEQRGSLRLLGHELVVHSYTGRSTRSLDDAELVELVDRLLARPRDQGGDVTGQLRVHGHITPITIAGFGHEWDPAADLARAIEI